MVACIGTPSGKFEVVAAILMIKVSPIDKIVLLLELRMDIDIDAGGGKGLGVTPEIVIASLRVPIAPAVPFNLKNP